MMSLLGGAFLVLVVLMYTVDSDQTPKKKKANAGDDGSFGGSIGHSTPQTIGSLVKKRGRAQSSSRNLWVDKEQRYVQVLRSGIPVVRKVGDTRRYDPTEEI